MHTNSSHIVRLLSTVTIAVLLTFISPAGLGQLNSRAGSISLVARLESLSIVAEMPNDFAVPARVPHGLDQIPVLLKTSWAVPSNRTMVRVDEDGKRLFSQATGDSNLPQRRIDRLNITVPCDGPEAANLQAQRPRLVIFVQAL
jgi:hypothetical protein